MPKLVDADNRDPVRARELAVAGLLAAAWLGINLLPLRDIPRDASSAPGLDAHVYIAMSESPTVFTTAPFGYRVGVPWLVHLLPLPLEAGFFLVTAMSLLLVFMTAYLLSRQLGFGHGLALLGLTFVATAPEVNLYLADYFLVDPAACALVAVLLLGIERSWSDARMAALLLVASLFKETAFLVLPVLYLRLAEPKLVSARAFARAFIVGVPAFSAALLLHVSWGSMESGFPYLTPWSVPRPAWFGSLDSYRFLWRYLFGYLALLAAANAFTEKGRAFLRRYGVFLALVIAQLIVPRNEDRLLFYAFPVIVPLALVEFHRMKEVLPDWYGLIAVTLVSLYLLAPEQLFMPIALVLLGRLVMELRRRTERA